MHKEIEVVVPCSYCMEHITQHKLFPVVLLVYSGSRALPSERMRSGIAKKMAVLTKVIAENFMPSCTP